MPAKGQRILLQAFAALQKEGRPLPLRFVGDGPMRRSLEDDAKRLGVDGAVRFEGAVNQDAIGQFYASADLFVLASLPKAYRC